VKRETRRRPVANVSLIDDNGRVRAMDEWRGQPVVIAPLYTRCPLACPLIASALKRAAANANTLPSRYRVIIFSFDPRDTPADLRRFRERHQLPLNWTLATAKPDDIRRLTDSIGFRYATIPGGFTHPKVVVALTPDLRTARYLFGTNYPAADFDAAISVARGGTDWLTRYAGVAIAVLLFVCTLSIAYVVMGLTRPKLA
jgi:protein SCO1/2